MVCMRAQVGFRDRRVGLNVRRIDDEEATFGSFFLGVFRSSDKWDETWLSDWGGRGCGDEIRQESGGHSFIYHVSK